MYDNGYKSGAHKVMVVIFTVVAIFAIGACAKIILDHVDSDGTVTSAEDKCINEEAMTDLEKAGIHGAAKPHCK